MFQRVRHEMASDCTISVGTICSKSNSFWRLTYYLLIALAYRAVLTLQLFMCYFEFNIFSGRMDEGGKLGTVDGYITTHNPT